MKKLSITPAVLLLLFVTMPLLQSCLDDWDGDDQPSITIGTIRIIDGKGYFFLLWMKEPKCIPEIPHTSITIP